MTHHTVLVYTWLGNTTTTILQQQGGKGLNSLKK